MTWRTVFPIPEPEYIPGEGTVYVQLNPDCPNCFAVLHDGDIEGNTIIEPDTIDVASPLAVEFGAILLRLFRFGHITFKS